MWLYHQAYKASIHESSHAAKDEAAQAATAEIKEDEIRLEGNISALTVQRDLLVTLLEHRAR